MLIFLWIFSIYTYQNKIKMLNALHFLIALIELENILLKNIKPRFQIFQERIDRGSQKSIL